MLSRSDAIGGYFGLELSSGSTGWFDGALRFNTARSAFLSLLRALPVNEIWLPHYLCDSMVDVVLSHDIEARFYDLSDNFEPLADIHLGDRSLLLAVNYFGLCDRQVCRLIDTYGADKVVVDNSQAQFSGTFGALATLYSPRKFFGLPDGGLLYCNNDQVLQPDIRDRTSAKRMDHLICRLADGPESGYPLYLAAEESLSAAPVLAMSALTERLMSSVDYDAARQARIRNARWLHEQLARDNRLTLDLSSSVAPLCYPFLPNSWELSRSELIEKRVYLPCYWPEVLTRVPVASFEWELVSNGFFLPCDQRYTVQDMDDLVQQLRGNS